MKTRTERAIYRGLAAALVLGAFAAVLVIPITRERGDARATACLSNMKRLGTGAVLYAVDHDETLPIASALGVPTAVGWAERISPFVRDAKVFGDPAEKGATVSYAMNANAVAIPKLASIAAPSRSILLYEIAGAREGRGGDLHATLRLSPVGDGAAGGLLDSLDPNLDPVVIPATGSLANSGLNLKLTPRHRGRSIFVRTDTSASSRLSEEVSAGVNARAANAPATISGGRRPDLPGGDRPRAEGSQEHVLAQVTSMTKDLGRRVLWSAVAFSLVALFLVMVAPYHVGFGNSKESARRSFCLSHLKRLSLATRLYVEENDETFPIGRIGAAPSALGWAARIGPQMERNPGYGSTSWTETLRDPIGGGEFGGYAMNANLAEQARISDHPDAERSVLLFEVGNLPLVRSHDPLDGLRRSPVGDGAVGGMVDSFDPLIASTVPATGATSNSGLPPSASSRHGGRANFAYVDGHAGSRDPHEISAGANAKGLLAGGFTSGCVRVDLPGTDRPCAASTGAWRGRGTFSLR